MLTNHELADFFDGFAEALPEFAPKLYAGGLNPADLTLYREIMAALYGVLAEYTGDDPAGIGPQPFTPAREARSARLEAWDGDYRRSGSNQPDGRGGGRGT